MRAVLIALFVAQALATTLSAQQLPEPDSYPFHPDEEVIQLDEKAFVDLYGFEAANFAKIDKLRALLGLSGAGMTIAILDTGLNVDHDAFKPKNSRIVAKLNLSSVGGPNDVIDKHGHGTHVTGIAAANSKKLVGVAPSARLAIIKITHNSPPLRTTTRDALQWVLGNSKGLNIVAVNLSIASGNATTPTTYLPSDIQPLIAQLRGAGVAVVVSAGNAFGGYRTEGMGHPAVFPESISVGAIFDADVGPIDFVDGTKAFKTGAGRYLPMSQRLHTITDARSRTDIFAPGALTVSAGITSNSNVSAVMSGTSQAAPVITGTIALLQEYAMRKFGRLATVDELEASLFESASFLEDGDDEKDNVPHANRKYPVIDALAAAQALERRMLSATRTRILNFLKSR